MTISTLVPLTVMLVLKLMVPLITKIPGWKIVWHPIEISV